MPTDVVAVPARVGGDEEGRRRLLFPAVFIGLVRGVVLSAAVGYSYGQVIHRHSGPALVTSLGMGGGLALYLVLGVVVCVELALLELRPRLGLVVTAAWSLFLAIVGVVAAVRDQLFWLLPTLVLALPPLLSLLRPASWRLAPLPWRRPTARRLGTAVLVHCVGAALLALSWARLVGSHPVLGGVVVVVVALGWLIAVLAWLPERSAHSSAQLSAHASAQSSAQLVPPQVAAYVLLVVLVVTVVS